MTITLSNVYMLTGLRITGSVQPYEYFSDSSKRLAKIADCTGWASYILNHVEDGLSVSEWEYVAFSECVAREIYLLWVVLWPDL